MKDIGRMMNALCICVDKCSHVRTNSHIQRERESTANFRGSANHKQQTNPLVQLIPFVNRTRYIQVEQITYF